MVSESATVTLPIIKKEYPHFTVEYVDYFEGLANRYSYHAEHVTVQWMLDNVKDDWIAIDAGAHIGEYTILLAHLAHHGKVFAFEASVVTFEKLLRNLGHNHMPWEVVEPICMALGDRAGFGIVEALAFAGQGKRQMQTIFTVPMDFTTVDRFCSHRRLEMLDLIKIDVDGWDLEVIEGAREAIKKYQPTVIIELGEMLALHDHTRADAEQLIEEIGYSIQKLGKNHLLLPEKKRE